jgi:hypothetical protein
MSAFTKAIRKQVALGRSLEFRPLRRRADGELVGLHLRLRSRPDDPEAAQEDRYVSNDLLDDTRIVPDRALAECVEHMGIMLTAAATRSCDAHPTALNR